MSADEKNHRRFHSLFCIHAHLVDSVFVCLGHFTIRGKLKGFTEELYLIETKSLVYEIKKSDLNSEQLQELKKKKTGHEVELVVTTESVARVRDRN